MPKRTVYRNIRVALLLFVLFMVAMSTWLAKLRSTDWDTPLWVVVYPIKGDNSEAVNDFVYTLQSESFASIRNFMAQEAKRYQLPLHLPVSIHAGPVINNMPPSPPTNGNILAIMLWSLQLRFWAFVNDHFDGPSPDIRIFVIYYDPLSNRTLSHSLGLEKGLIGVVHGFASQALNEENNVIITHELLHTVGASDKYNPSDNTPVFPSGYANPDKRPRYPQSKAEIMGGRIPISANQAVRPSSLKETVIGKTTALEINWIK